MKRKSKARKPLVMGFKPRAGSKVSRLSKKQQLAVLRAVAGGDSYTHAGRKVGLDATQTKRFCNAMGIVSKLPLNNKGGIGPWSLKRKDL